MLCKKRVCICVKITQPQFKTQRPLITNLACPEIPENSRKLFQAETCDCTTEDGTLEWKRVLAACGALRDAASSQVEPDDKIHVWVGKQLALHSEAIALDDQHARWHHLGNNVAARAKADATGVSADAVAKALVNLDKAVEQAMQTQLQAPFVGSVKAEQADADFDDQTTEQAKEVPVEGQVFQVLCFFSKLVSFRPSCYRPRS